MTLNVSKSAVMCLTRKQKASQYSYTADSNSSRTVNQYTYLCGVIFANLRRNSDVNVITLKVLKELLFLRRRLRHTTPEIKLLTYTIFVRLALECHNVAGYTCIIKLVKKHERVQRKAIQFNYNEYNLIASPSELINRAGLLTPQNCAKQARLKIIYQLIYNLLYIDSTRYLSKSKTRQTRFKHTQRLQSCSFSTECVRFFLLETSEWNSLPSQIIYCPTLETFLQSVESHLFASQV